MGHIANKKVLMLAYYFPPFGSVGWSIRAVKFVKYLPDMGWAPIVLTISDDDYLISRSSSLSAGELPEDLVVYRARAVEPRATTFRQLQDVTDGSPAHWVKQTIRAGLRLLQGYILIPDDKILWAPFALWTGRRVASKEKPEVILATCPPYSVAIVGWALSQIVQIPLVLDVRDDWLTPMHFAHKPKAVRGLERWMEALVVRKASAVVLVTERSRADFVARYPNQAAAKFHYIPNGCDLSELATLSEESPPRVEYNSSFVMLHSGSLYQSRNPSGFVAALRQLAQSDPALARRLQVVFRGDLWSDYKKLLSHAELASTIRLGDFLPRTAYLQASQRADVMLVIADRRSPNVIPGKVYECWALGKPILILAEEGAAADFVRDNGLGMATPPDEPDQIAETILRLVRRVDQGEWQPPSAERLRQFDRRALAGKMAALLSDIVSSSRGCA